MIVPLRIALVPLVGNYNKMFIFVMELNPPPKKNSQKIPKVPKNGKSIFNRMALSWKFLGISGKQIHVLDVSEVFFCRRTIILYCRQTIITRLLVMLSYSNHLYMVHRLFIVLCPLLIQCLRFSIEIVHNIVGILFISE